MTSKSQTAELVPNSAGSPPKYYHHAVIAIYAVAIVLRILRYVSTGLSPENAIIGSTAEEFLRGDYPLFLLGKNHMGTYDALLSAPLIHLFGPSSYILNLWPPLFSMGVMVAMHRLLRRLLDPWGVLMGLLYMAVPPALWLFYSGYPQTHYSLGVLLSAVLMLLTARLWESRQWRIGPAFVWGLAAGAMLYTNPQTVGVFLPCIIVLVIFAWRRIRPGNLAAFFCGGVVGGLPLAYYLLTRGASYGEQASVFGQHYLGQHLQALFTNALPIIMGFSTYETGGNLTPALVQFSVYLLVLAIAVAGLAGLLVQGLRNKPGPALLFPLITAFYLALLLPSSFGDAMHRFNQVYLLPLYLVLPVCFGMVMVWLVRYARPAAVLLPLLALGVSINGYYYYNQSAYAFFASPAKQYEIDAANRGQARQLRQSGIKDLYADDSWLLGYYTNGDPLAVHTWHARKAMDGHRVDASLDPLYYGVDLKGSAALLGLNHKSGVVAGRNSYWGFGQPDKGRLLPRDSWRAATLVRADLGRSLNDGDLSTGYSTDGPATDGRGFILDLGSSQILTSVALVPIEHLRVPAGLKIEASTDGQAYETLRQTTKYWGPFYMSGPHAFMRTRHIRVESYWPARPVRYLRISHLGNSKMPWSVREVLAWGPQLTRQAPPSWPDSGEMLLQVLRQSKPGRLYADVWPAAVLRLGLEYHPWITVTQPMDNTGKPAYPKGTWPVLNHDPGSAVVVNAPDADTTAETLARLGVEYNRRDAGRFVVFDLLGQKWGQPIEPLKISSDIDPQKAASLVGEGGAWSSLGPQNQGASLVADMGRVRPVRWLELRNPNFANDYPRGLTAWVSDDGQQWRDIPVKAAGPLVWSGQVPLVKSGAINVYDLGSGLRTRYVKLATQTSEPKWWWSVERMVLYAPPGG